MSAKDNGISVDILIALSETQLTANHANGLGDLVKGYFTQENAKADGAWVGIDNNFGDMAMFSEDAGSNFQTLSSIRQLRIEELSFNSFFLSFFSS